MAELIASPGMKKNRQATMSWIGPPSIQPCLNANITIVDPVSEAANGAR